MYMSTTSTFTGDGAMPFPRGLLTGLLTGLLLLGGSACFDEPPPAVDTSNLVFDDTLVDADFQAFQGSKLDALSRDTNAPHVGKACLKVAVPSSAEGGYAGGAFVASSPRNLSRFDALTFWAKASAADVTLDLVGLANDNTGTSKFTAEWKGVALSTTWNKYFVPIPLPSRLTLEKGLFHFAAPAAGQGYTVWFDDIGFEALGAGVLGEPRLTLTSSALSHSVGDSFDVPSPSVIWAVNGVDQTLKVALQTFDFTSSNPSVVQVNAQGHAEALASGTAIITASLGGTPVSGQATVTVTVTVTGAAGVSPDAPAPTPPALAAASVLSLFSNAFTSVPVDTWRADWSMAGPVTEAKVAGDDVKKYSQLQYAGVVLTTHPLDVSAMTALHLDVWTPDSTSLKVKLVDFGADGAYSGGDDKESELVFNASSNPALTTKSWVRLELPLSSFTTLTTRAHVAQLVFSGTSSTVYVDNVYFHK